MSRRPGAGGAGPGLVVGRSWREAVLVSGRDAFVDLHLAPASVREVRSGDGWWSVLHAPTSYFEHGGLLVGGDVTAVTDVVQGLSERLRPHEVTVDVRVPLDLAHPDHGSRWAWLHTTRPLPAVPGEDLVVWSPEAGAVDALLDEANPDAFVRPDSPAAHAWAAVPDADGSLLACGAVTFHTPVVPHLASVAVSPRARRQGLGAALSAAMVRRLLRTAPAVTLALWAGNTTARALYDRVGFAGGHDYATRELLRG